MEVSTWLPIVMVIVLFAVLNIVSSAYDKNKSILTFSKYKEKHPDLVKDGTVVCIHCSSSKIFVRSSGGANYHACLACGEVLYKTNSFT